VPHKCIWVLAAGPHQSANASAARLPKADMVIAANGGSALAVHLGIVPDLVIGDLDSADPRLIEKWEHLGVEMRRYSHTTKNETDTELAVLAALEWLQGASSTIYILGATGGRLDHTVANILLLTFPHLRSVDVRVVQGEQEVFLAKPGQWNQIAGQPGDLMSLLPVGRDATGVILEGFVYPLQRETLSQGSGRGVSNEIATQDARLWLDAGRLLVIVSHGIGVRNQESGVSTE
jgi:thiamine pyrophosphokinase